MTSVTSTQKNSLKNFSTAVLVGLDVAAVLLIICTPFIFECIKAYMEK